jgi:hypothetical protein
MKTTLALAMLAMSAPQSCDPTALEGAEIRPGDGGVWLGGQDGGVFISQTDVPGGGRQLPELPPDDILCLLYPGDINSRTDYPDSFQGTWIEDVIQPWLLGPVDGTADSRDSENAQLRYSYRNPFSTRNDGTDALTLNLVFESAPAHVGNGVPLHNAYFLTKIVAVGMDKVQAMRGGRAPTCWDWRLRETKEYGATYCEQCSYSPRDFILCAHTSEGREDVRSCFNNDNDH